MHQKSLPLLIFITTIFVTANFWFHNIERIGLNPDEVPYTLNSQFYFFRKSGQMEKFHIVPEVETYPWWSAEFQLLDQPQFGRYLAGFILDNKGISATSFGNTKELLRSFASSQLPEGVPLDQINDIIPPELITAIRLLRPIYAFLGFLMIVIISTSIGLWTKSFLIASAALLFLSTRSVFFETYRLALMNSPSLFILVVTVIGMYLFFSRFQTLSRSMQHLAAVGLGGLTATATSIKLNGGYLLLLPLPLLILINLFAYMKGPKKIDYPTLKSSAIFLTLFVLSFSIFFVFFEPELRDKPLQNTYLLFNARVVQQERFYSFFGKQPWYATPGRALKVLIKPQSSHLLALVFAILSSIGIIDMIQVKMNHSKQRKTILLLLLILILISNSHYALITFRGFDRYYTPTILALTFLAANGLKVLKEISKAKARRHFPILCNWLKSNH